QPINKKTTMRPSSEQPTKIMLATPGTISLPSEKRSEAAPLMDFLSPQPASAPGNTSFSNTRPSEVEARLKGLLTAALYLDEAIDPAKKFIDYGMDSITGVEFTKSVNAAFSLNLSATDLYDHPTIVELGSFIHSQLPPEEETKVTVVPSSPSFSSFAIHPSSPYQGYLVKGIQEVSTTHWEGIPVAAPGPEEVQLKVMASSINFPDIMCIKGLYPTIPSYPFVPGFEVSGIIEQVGEKVSSSWIGKEVVAMTGKQLGGHASHVNVSRGSILTKPATISHEEACSLPVIFLTVYHGLVHGAGLARDEQVLIQTAAGGCGLMAVQLAHLLGAVPVGTSSKAEKLAFLQSIGVEQVGNYASPDFEAVMRSLTGGRGFDVVLNMLSGAMIQTGLNLLGSGGRYIELAVHGLKTAPKLDLSGLMDNQEIKSLDLRRMLLSNGVGQQEVLREAWSKLVDWVEQGCIYPVVSRVYPLSMIDEGMSYVESGRHIGKVVISHTATVMHDYEGELQRQLVHQKQHAQRSRIVLKASGKRSSTIAREEGVSTDIAIIGVCSRMPGSETIEAFWAQLKGGVDAVAEVPEDRWRQGDYYDADPGVKGKSYSKWMGMLKEIDRFDPLFFNISPREAELMDPQQRIWLEACWQCIEDAGYTSKALSADRCGVFIGVGSGDYLQSVGGEDTLEAQSLTGNSSSILSARVSYFLNLTGPALAIDTACSSSLVAISQACESLVSGVSDVALSGGVCVLTTPRMHVLTSKAGMLSADGRCHTFDASANGFVPGEGVG
ncbi:MAG: beta-ketoacyl synthase N-terminal-like domain-containing protein, partial [Cyanobacteria bacterium P01_C01_bin.147]